MEQGVEDGGGQRKREATPALRAVLFDFDGTLAPSLPLWIEAYHTALRAFGMTLTDAEVLRRCFFRDWADVAADLGVCTALELEAAVDRGLRQAFAAAALFPLARDLIEHCREHGLRTALVTSSPRGLIDTVAAQLGVQHLFDFVICGGEAASYKPHPDPVLRTLRALDCAPQAAVMIGDSAADILAGKAAGTRTGLFMPDDHGRFHDGERLRATQPDFIFREHGELWALLGLLPRRP
jgi:phosphoglycolate phosphatase/AHBA synthesis associated protein